jgi:tRNA nucleotidyltransferase (CCA-adding enzyme)
VTPEALLQRLPNHSLEILAVAKQAGHNVYLVGGILRNIVLGVSLQDNDLDFVVETHAEQVVKYMHNVLGGHLTEHSSFGTFTLKTSDFIIDITTARKESYAYPGALPTVSFSHIYDDLARRDFSINAMALRLQPLELLDPHFGLNDVKAKTLRILHPQSFQDDPTRMIRGARLAGRFDLDWEAQTKMKIAEALASEAVGNISNERMKHELGLCLSETKVLPVLQALEPVLRDYFALSFIPEVIQTLDTFQQHQAIPSESYLLAILLPLKEPEDFIERFHYPLRHKESLKRIRDGLTSLSSDLFARLSQAEKWVLRAINQDLNQHIQTLEQVFSRRRLTGQDVLDLGLLSGPTVGQVLAEVSRARDSGQVSGYEQELELARHLVLALQENQ